MTYWLEQDIHSHDASKAIPGAVTFLVTKESKQIRIALKPEQVLF